MVLRGLSLFSGLLSLLITALTGGFSSPGRLLMVPVWFLAVFVGVLLLFFLFLIAACQFVDERKPQEKDSKFYRILAAILLEILLPLFRVKLDVQGMEKVPKQGRFLLVCNHLSIADPPVLLHCFRSSQLGFISKQENNSLFLIGKIMHKISCQLINRENDREALKTILRCIQLIQEDRVSIAVFPEGKCSLDGRLDHFRSGVFKIAQKTKVPIVVCTVKNTQDVFHNICRFRATHIPVHLVEVIQPESYKGMPTVEIADMVYEKMIADLGEEFRV